MSSQRQTIFAAVKTRLETITTAAGYRTDAGANVTEWDLRPFAEYKSPQIDLRDVKRSTEGILTGYQKHTLHLEARLVTATGSTTSQTLRDLEADIIAAIGTDRKFGGIAEDAILGDAETDLAKENKTFGATLFRFAVTYRAPYWNPEP